MSVIVLEFNELTPALMDRFIDEGRLPNFKRFREQSIVAVTDAEEAAPNLEPWIQWVTVHTGLSYGQHQVFNLDDGGKLTAPRIWDIASDAGKTIWICGSMNAAVRSERPNGLVLPDPWATRIEPYPKRLFAPFFHFVSAHVREHSASKAPVTLGDQLRFAWFMLRHGLSPRAIFEAAAQLVGERAGRGRWRRAVVLDRLQWDLFKHFQKRLRPSLSTFFLNSTAHFQHYHWRNLEPERFLVQPSEADQREYMDAILFGYRKMDEVVGEALAMVGPQDTLVLCTALGQQPLLKYEDAGGSQLFRMHDPGRLLNFAGVEAPFRHAPVMADGFRIDFESAAAAQHAAERICALRLPGDARVMWAKADGVELYGGVLSNLVQPQGSLVSSVLHNHAMPFDELFYPIGGALKSGMHHPHGILWFRRPDHRHVRVERLVSLQEIAPTLLALADIASDVEFARAPMPEVVTRTPAPARPAARARELAD